MQWFLFFFFVCLLFFNIIYFFFFLLLLLDGSHVNSAASSFKNINESQIGRVIDVDAVVPGEVDVDAIDVSPVKTTNHQMVW